MHDDCSIQGSCHQCVSGWMKLHVGHLQTVILFHVGRLLIDEVANGAVKAPDRQQVAVRWV